MRFAYSSLLVLILLVSSVALQAQMAPQMPNTSLAQMNGGVGEPNLLNLGLGFSTAYDDNAFNSVVPNAQVLYTITPNVAWNITRPHWQSDMDYSAYISESNKYSYWDRTSQTLNTKFSYQFSPRLSFNVADMFSHLDNPFYMLTSTGNTTAGTPNPSYFSANQIRTSNYVDASVDYRLDARTDLVVGGNYFFSRYSGTPTASLVNSNDASGRISYKHQFSARNTTGLEYDYMKITTPSFGFSTVSQRIMVTDQFVPRPDMTLSVFAGPNYVANDLAVNQNGTSQSLTNSEWTWSAGATYTWTLKKMAMTASAIRQISDGGGLVGTVTLSSIQYVLHANLPHKFTGSINVGYNLNDRLIAQSLLTTKAKYGSAGASLSRQFQKNFAATVSYQRVETLVDQGLQGVPAPWIDRDRITASINYTFSHPLGR